MMPPSDVLCIDLGAAYTKVAARHGVNDQSKLARADRLAEEDVSFCIPSVVAEVKRGKLDHWVVGIEAASQRRGEGVRVYENWKRSLFEPIQRPTSADAIQPDEIATRFLRGLRSGLARTAELSRFTAMPTRLCVPHLNTGADVHGKTAFERQRQLFDGILREAGWTPVNETALVFEPEANLVGVLTRGRNRMWTPPALDYQPKQPEMQLPLMLDDSGLLRAFQKVKGHYGVLIIDVGAFTTDFAHVSFDAGFSSKRWMRPSVTQESYPVGITELDEDIIVILPPEIGEAVARLNPAEWEQRKRQLYSGDGVAFLDGRGRSLRFGTTNTEQHMITEAISAFADRVRAAYSDFCDHFVESSVNARLFTGGGILIPRLREFLLNIPCTEATADFDLLDPNEPRRALGRNASVRAIDERRRSNRELMRGATAVGGCSIFFA